MKLRSSVSIVDPETDRSRTIPEISPSFLPPGPSVRELPRLFLFPSRLSHFTIKLYASVIFSRHLGFGASLFLTTLCRNWLRVQPDCVRTDWRGKFPCCLHPEFLTQLLAKGLQEKPYQTEESGSLQLQSHIIFLRASGGETDKCNSDKQGNVTVAVEGKEPSAFWLLRLSMLQEFFSVQSW